MTFPQAIFCRLYFVVFGSSLHVIVLDLTKDACLPSYDISFETLTRISSIWPAKPLQQRYHLEEGRDGE